MAYRDETIDVETTVHTTGLGGWQDETLDCGGALTIDDEGTVTCTVCDTVVGRKCGETNCGDVYPVDHWENGDGRWSELLEAWVCWPCYENDGAYVSTVLRFNPDGEHWRVYLGDVSVASGTVDEIYDDEVPDWLSELFEDGKVKRGYVRTDGWRGYYDTPMNMTGVKKITDGWVTGDYDDPIARRKSLTHDLRHFLVDEGNNPPQPLYWIFEPTSNVFSTASEVFVKEGDYDEVVSWLADNGFSVEALEGAFG